EMKGIPVRIAIGARDLAKKVVEVARRDTGEKMNYPVEGLSGRVISLLDEIQLSIFNKARRFRDERIIPADDWDQFVNLLDEQPGFISAHWDGTAETEEKIKELTKATIRCIPLNNAAEEGKCILTGQPSSQRVLFARAY